ncbi:hypothetical protein DITRI_Ditri10aG0020100 [Diplodiscus trichospermus]
MRDRFTTDGFQTTIRKQDDDGFPANPINIHKEIPHIVGENQFLVESESGIEQLHESKELPDHSLFEADDLTVKSSSTFDQINNDPHNICSEFEAKSNHASGHDLGTDSKLELEIPCKELQNPIADTEGCSVEITKLELEIPCKEPFYMNVDAKNVIDKSYFDGLSLLLASSKTNYDQYQMPCASEAMTYGTQDDLAKVSCSHMGELDEVAASCTADGPVACNSKFSSASTSNSQFPEPTNVIICCTLNTEDPEIPAVKMSSPNCCTHW